MSNQHPTMENPSLTSHVMITRKKGRENLSVHQQRQSESKSEKHKNHKRKKKESEQEASNVTNELTTTSLATRSRDKNSNTGLGSSLSIFEKAQCRKAEINYIDTSNLRSNKPKMLSHPPTRTQLPKHSVHTSFATSKVLSAPPPSEEKVTTSTYRRPSFTKAAYRLFLAVSDIHI
jgi:phage-related minor tail protein